MMQCDEDHKREKKGQVDKPEGGVVSGAPNPPQPFPVPWPSLLQGVLGQPASWGQSGLREWKNTMG
jgi:hypothetical protein